MDRELNFCVYIHTCLAEGSSYGKKYVGVTSQAPERRWGNGKNYKHCLYFHNAIQKYGWNSFSHEVIASGLSLEDAYALERELISCFKTYDPDNGFNLTRGGNNLFDGENPCSRAVVLFDCHTGCRVAEFQSEASASAFIGAPVYQNLANKSRTCGRYICRYADDVIGVQKLNHEELTKPGAQLSKRKAVDQFDVNGNYIQSFPSILEAELSVGCTRDVVGNAVRGVSKSGAGFQWRFSSDGFSSVPPLKDRWAVRKENGNYKGKCVEQIDPESGRIIGSFCSLHEASRKTGISRSTISSALNRPLGENVSHGFEWRYSSE